MKLWVGGIIDAEVADEFRHLRNSMEESINNVITEADYGSGMSTWDVILVISSTPPSEYVRYSKTNKESDVRVVIDFDTFLVAEASERSNMLGQALLKSIESLSKKKIVGFDFTALRRDVVAILN
jgi:hypothetical protein